MGATPGPNLTRKTCLDLAPELRDAAHLGCFESQNFGIAFSLYSVLYRQPSSPCESGQRGTRQHAYEIMKNGARDFSVPPTIGMRRLGVNLLYCRNGTPHVLLLSASSDAESHSNVTNGETAYYQQATYCTTTTDSDCFDLLMITQ